MTNHGFEKIEQLRSEQKKALTREVAFHRREFIKEAYSILEVVWAEDQKTFENIKSLRGHNPTEAVKIPLYVAYSARPVPGYDQKEDLALQIAFSSVHSIDNSGLPRTTSLSITFLVPYMVEHDNDAIKECDQSMGVYISLSVGDGSIAHYMVTEDAIHPFVMPEYDGGSDSDTVSELDLSSAEGWESSMAEKASLIVQLRDLLHKMEPVPAKFLTIDDNGIESS